MKERVRKRWRVGDKQVKTCVVILNRVVIKVNYVNNYYNNMHTIVKSVYSCHIYILDLDLMLY